MTTKLTNSETPDQLKGFKVRFDLLCVKFGIGPEELAHISHDQERALIFSSIVSKRSEILLCLRDIKKMLDWYIPDQESTLECNIALCEKRELLPPEPQPTADPETYTLVQKTRDIIAALELLQQLRAGTMRFNLGHAQDVIACENAKEAYQQFTQRLTDLCAKFKINIEKLNKLCTRFSTKKPEPNQYITVEYSLGVNLLIELYKKAFIDQNEATKMDSQRELRVFFGYDKYLSLTEMEPRVRSQIDSMLTYWESKDLDALDSPPISAASTKERPQFTPPPRRIERLEKLRAAYGIIDKNDASDHVATSLNQIEILLQNSATDFDLACAEQSLRSWEEALELGDCETDPAKRKKRKEKAFTFTGAFKKFISIFRSL